MRVTAKCEYALRSMISLATLSAGDRPVPIRVLAAREGLSHEMLQQTLHRLRKAGLIEAVRGPGGGFFLARPASEIMVLEVLAASGSRNGEPECPQVEGLLRENCMKEDSPGASLNSECRTCLFWRDLDRICERHARKTSLQDLLA